MAMRRLSPVGERVERPERSDFIQQINLKIQIFINQFLSVEVGEIFTFDNIFHYIFLSVSIAYGVIGLLGPAIRRFRVI